MLRMVLTVGLGFAAFTAGRADDWPQWLGPKRDGVWRETGLIDVFPKNGPKKVWDAEIGAGYAGPAVADGRVILADRHLAEGARLPGNAFSTAKVDGVERVLCFDSHTGKRQWKIEYPCVYGISYATGPRCTPTVDGDRVYVLGAMGHLHCLDVKTGRKIWKKNFVKDYQATVPVWGFAAHPLIDGDKLICLAGGSDGCLVIAFDKMTGREIWTALECPGDFGYCPPMIYEFAGQRQLIIWHAQAIVGMNPQSGKKLWSVPFQSRSSLTVPTPRAVAGDRLFVSAFYNGSLLLEIQADAARIVWKGTGKGEKPDQTADVHSIMTTPMIDGDYAYSVCSYGELRCIKVNTGERVWATNQATRGHLTPAKVKSNPAPSTSQPWHERWAHAFLIPNGDRTFLFNEQGELIIAKLSPKGYEEVSRTVLIEPTNSLAGRPVLWMHPAFADKKIYVRNDKTLACFDLAKP
jgi:outer membrane protein assembly factor BamB